MRTALILTLVVAASVLAGCASSGAGESTTPPDGGAPLPSTTGTPVAPPENARFELSPITIHGPDGAETIREDDERAIVRYTVSQPADAPRGTAFVTYLLDGRVVDVQQLTLEPGTERAFERIVTGLRERPTIEVEVRAGGAVERAQASVQPWPRAGDDALELGPLSIRADYGLLAQDSRAIVNLTIAHAGGADVWDLRVEMLCVMPNGTIDDTHDVPLPVPSAGNTTSVDASVDDCPAQRYGLELKATGAGGAALRGRLLLVEEGWRPPASEPGTQP